MRQGGGGLQYVANCPLFWPSGEAGTGDECGPWPRVGAPWAVSPDRVIMPRGPDATRERQYEHIKESAEKRGESTARAKGIAAADRQQGAGPCRGVQAADKSSVEDNSSAGAEG